MEEGAVVEASPIFKGKRQLALEEEEEEDEGKKRKRTLLTMNKGKRQVSPRYLILILDMYKTKILYAFNFAPKDSSPDQTHEEP